MISKNDPKMKWFEEARLGMFIHWGLYSATEGIYNGKETNGIVEWIQAREQIPCSEYEKFVSNLSTEKFDAEEIASLAYEAGVKYVTFTSKHHEGFAMFDSKYSDYNIMKMCKADKDPVKELCEKVRKKGMHACLYYSQSLDFHEENAMGNTWDFETPETERDLQSFLDGKTKFQLNELLTNYGKIDMIWFDVPRGMTYEMGEDLRKYVLERQPHCIINGRLVYPELDEGGDLQDYVCMGDNEILQQKIERCAEAPATTNNSWGYKRDDKDFKSSEDIINLLCSLVSKGVNMLLNIGPKPDGSVPDEAVKIFRDLGAWMKVNSEAVYGTKASPFLSDFSFGWMAKKENRLYLYVKKPQNEVKLYNICEDVISAKVLGGGDVKFKKCENELLLDFSNVKIGEGATVVCITLSNELKDIGKLIQQEENYIYLPGCYCKEESAEYIENEKSSDENDINSGIGESIKNETSIEITNNGVVGWKSENDFVYWDFEVQNPGEYDIVLYTRTKKYMPWVGGHKVTLECGKEKFVSTLSEDVIPDGINRKYFSETGSIIGKVNFETKGTYKLKLTAEEINKEDVAGLGVTRVIFKKSEIEDLGF